MIKKSYWTVLSTIAFAIQSFATNKIFSVYFGPVGVTMLAHFQNIIAVFVAIPSEGINKAVTTKLTNQNLSQSAYNATISGSLVLNLYCFIFTIFLFLLLLPFYKSDFPNTFFDIKYVFLILFAISCHIIVLYIGNLLLSSNQIKIFSILGIINNIIAFVVVYIGIQFELFIALVFVSFSPCLLLLLSFYYYKKYNYSFVSNFTFKLDRIIQNEMFVFVGAAISVVVFGKLTDFFVRSYIISTYNSYQTGLWQAVSKISDGYSTVFMAAFGTLIFVKLSSLSSDAILLGKFLRKIIFFVLVISVISLLILYAFREIALVFFYNTDFVPAKNLFTFQCIGDVFKFQFLILSNVLLVQMKTKLYVFLNAFSAIIYVIFILFLSNYMDINGINVAHCMRWVCMTLVIFFLLKDKIIKTNML